MKNKKAKKDGLKSVLVDKRDHERWKQLDEQMVNLKSTFENATQMRLFLFQSYAGKGEEITGANVKTGTLTIKKKDDK